MRLLLQEVLTEDEYENNETYSESEQKLDIKIEPEEITPPTPSIVIEVNGKFSSIEQHKDAEFVYCLEPKT